MHGFIASLDLGIKCGIFKKSVELGWSFEIFVTIHIIFVHKGKDKDYQITLLLDLLNYFSIQLSYLSCS